MPDENENTTPHLDALLRVPVYRATLLAALQYSITMDGGRMSSPNRRRVDLLIKAIEDYKP